MRYVMLRYLLSAALLFLLLSCGSTSQTGSNGNDAITSDSSKLPMAVHDRLQNLLSLPVNGNAFPRSVEPDGSLILKPVEDWTTGFPPGVLWIAYSLSGDERYRERAAAWTEKLQPQTLNANSHDVGFQINCSYGEGYKLNQGPAYREALITAAKTLTTRYNDTVGAIKSWDWGDWKYPVIIDNMMNLELLYLATELSGDTSFAYIANRHATTTLNNHFREDNSTWHVIDYDPATGDVFERKTHQGISDESAWARGQAWGLYGFTMAHARTGRPEFLSQAEKIATLLIDHPRLPADGVPYWDFDDPAIPNVPRDASAGAIIASALYQLDLLSDARDDYRATADRIVASLGSDAYLLPADSKLPFILTHSTGHHPKDSEIDVPINYADYYFMEALRRRAGEI